MQHRAPKFLTGAAMLAALLVLSACSFSLGGKSMDQAEVEKKISAALKEQVGTAPDKVVCPGDLKAEKGTKMRCVLTADGTRYGVTVTVTSVKGDTVNFGIKVDDTPLGSSGSSSGSGPSEAGAAQIGAAILAAAKSGVLEGSTLDVDDDSTACLGSAVAKSLGAENAKQLAGKPYSEYTEVEAAAVKSAMDKCLKGSTIAADLTSGFYSELDSSLTPTPAVTTCVQGAVEGKVGTILFEATNDSPDAAPATVLGVFETCIPKSDLAAVFTQQLGGSSGLSGATLDCAANKLATEFTLTELFTLGNSSGGSIPPEAEQRITAAVESCA